jgi:hypothetical protein
MREWTDKELDSFQVLMAFIITAIPIAGTFALIFQGRFWESGAFFAMGMGTMVFFCWYWW